jgi:hypothetical protein
MDHSDECIKPIVWVLKVYLRRKWTIFNIYSSRAKAQRVASEFDTDVSITKWLVK